MENEQQKYSEEMYRNSYSNQNITHKTLHNNKAEDNTMNTDEYNKQDECATETQW